jgi:hypothetical protein
MLSVPLQTKEKGQLFGLDNQKVGILPAHSDAFLRQLAKRWQGSDEAWDLQSEQWAIRVVHGLFRFFTSRNIFDYVHSGLLECAWASFSK